MDLTKIIGVLEEGAAFVEKIAPLAGEIGGPIVGSAITAAEAVIAIGTNAIDRAIEAKTVFSTTDQAAIQAVIARLAVVNDALAKAIAAS